MTRVVLSLLTAFLFVAAYMLSLFLVAMAGERAGEWRAVRNAYAASHPACAACGAKADLQVHHVKPFHLWPALELESSNLIALCLVVTFCSDTSETIGPTILACEKTRPGCWRE